MSAIKSFFTKIVPVPLRFIPQRRRRTYTRNCVERTGWARSDREKKCVDADGHATPWFSYPAIHYLLQLDLREKSVFEYGSGSSTQFWAEHCKQVTAVEDFPDWHAKVSSWLPANAKVLLTTSDPATYAGQIDTYGKFDIIVIDGTPTTRRACAERAVEHLSDTGMIILDNAERFPLSAEHLRKQDLIEVDFHGFAPLQLEMHCTSLFLRRGFQWKTVAAVQPAPPPIYSDKAFPGQ